MLQLKNVSKQFADQHILRQVEWHLRPGDRIGLCGENGSGKTTLLRLLAGHEQVDSGEILLAKGTTIGYLPQDGLIHAGKGLFSEVRSAMTELLHLEAELKNLESNMGKRDSQEELEHYAELQERFRQLGGYTLDAEIGQVLSGLGFCEEDLEKTCDHFSGGWQMRIALAKLLLQKPTLLLLDEPTNHLDLPARDWLEDYLARYPHTVILVSHDRFFLDQVVNRIVEIWHGTLTDYSGNYSRYRSARAERLAALREAKRRQDEEIAKTEAFVAKFRYNANKAALVQSRIKQLKKIERIDVPPERKRIAFRFPPPPKGGRLALALAQVRHGYGGQTVLDHVDLTIERGDRIALVGVNGAGKSTLMRLLAGVENPWRGTREEGANLAIAYFAQDQSRTLDCKLTVLEQITRVAPFEMVPEVRNLLGAFLFHGDDVHKRVGMLSGGERNRLALAILLLRPANLLLLDEPTNHLDLASKEVLLDAMRSYQGTLVFVSHDRYFVDALATRVVEVASGIVTAYPGNYEDFLAAKNREGDASHSEFRVEQLKVETENRLAHDNKQIRAQMHADRKASRREQQRRQKEIEQIELQIEQIESQIGACDDAMGNPEIATDHEELSALAQKRGRLQGELDKHYRRWEVLHAQNISGSVS